MSEKLFSDLIDMFRERKPKEKVDDILEKFDELFKYKPQDEAVLYFIINFRRFEESFFLDLTPDRRINLFEKILNLQIEDESLFQYKSELINLYNLNKNGIKINIPVSVEYPQKQIAQNNGKNISVIKEHSQPKVIDEYQNKLNHSDINQTNKEGSLQSTIVENLPKQKINTQSDNQFNKLQTQQHTTLEFLPKPIAQNIQNNTQAKAIEMQQPIFLENPNKNLSLNGNKLTSIEPKKNDEENTQKNSKGTVIEKPNLKKRKIEDKIYEFIEFEGKTMYEYIKEKEDRTDFYNNGLFDENSLNDNITKLLDIETQTVIMFINLYLKISFIFKSKQIVQVKNLFKTYLMKKEVQQESFELILSVNVTTDIWSRIFAESNMAKNPIKFEENKIDENYKLYCYNRLYNFLDENQKDFLCFIIYIFSKKTDNNPKLINSLIYYRLFLKDDKIEKKNIESLEIKQDKLLYINQINILKLKENKKEFQFLESDEETRCEFILKNLQKHFNITDENLYKTMKTKNMIYIKEFICMLNFYKSLSKRSINVRKNLENIEKELQENFRKAKKNYAHCFEKCSNSYAKDYHIKIIEELKEKISKEVKGNDIIKNVQFYIIPFGSTVQFLGKVDSDLDLALMLDTNDTKKIQNFWKMVDNLIYKEIDKKKQIILTARLFTIKFTYLKIKVDLNYFGKCGILNSNLIRYYSLIDVRFPILVYNIKKIVKDLKISNTDERKEFLNSYSWVLIIITFLQEYLPIPVLPKLLEDKMIQENIKIFNFEKKKKSHGQFRDFEEICKNNHFMEEKYELYEFPIEYQNIYHNFREQHQNTQTVSELFVKLIEFLAYIFKYDSLFIDFKNQKIEAKRNLNNDQNLLKQEEKDKKNYFLITDPFDHTYNPAKDLKNRDSAKTFFDTLKNLHKKLLEEGKIPKDEYFNS